MEKVIKRSSEGINHWLGGMLRLKKLCHSRPKGSYSPPQTNSSTCRQTKELPTHPTYSKPVFPNHAYRHRISFTSPLFSFVCLRPTFAAAPHPMLKRLIQRQIINKRNAKALSTRTDGSLSFTRPFSACVAFAHAWRTSCVLLGGDFIGRGGWKLIRNLQDFVCNNMVFVVL